MKTQKQYRLIVLLTLLLLSPMAQGQEFTKVIPLQKSQDMIIRDYTGNEWIVYTRYLGATELESVFLLVSDTGSIAPLLTLPSSIEIINDFEVFDGKVYFCGKNKNGRAVMGIFSLQGFPNTEVCIWTVLEMGSFNKLDVNMLNSTLHVMMTGEAVLGSSHMIDAIPLSLTQWDFCISTVIDGWRFDDVAITTSRVVFSAWQNQGSKCFLIEYTYPSMSSTIMPGATIPYILVSTGSEMLLKASSPTRYAFVLNTSYGPLVGEVTSGLAYVWNNFLGNPSTPSIVRVNDIAYNSLANRVDVLTTGVPGTSSCLLHPYGTTAMPTPPMFYGHGVMGNSIRSVDGVGNASGFFIGAGQSVTLDFLTLYRYKYNVWQDCFMQKDKEFEIMTKWANPSKMDVLCKNFTKEAECAFCETNIIPVYDECIVNNNN